MNKIPFKKVIHITLSSKMKVILLFLISLGIPSVFLLYLAIRGIENDQTLAKQRLLSEHKAMANSLATGVDKEISLVKEELHYLLQEYSDFADSNLIEPIDRVASSALVDEVFLLKEDSLVFPHAKLLYQIKPSQLLKQIKPDRVNLDRLINEAEMNEFQLNDYTRAGELYRLALNQAHNDDTRVDLLMRLARVSARKGALTYAQETFTAVINRYSKNKLPGGLPAGLAAWIEIIGLELRGGNTAKAGRHLFKLYQSLLEGIWSLNRSQFHFVRNKIDSLSRNLKDTVTLTNVYRKIEELSNTVDSLVSRTEYVIEVSNAALPTIRNLIGVEIGSRSPSNRLIIQSNESQFLLLLTLIREPCSNCILAAGAIINQSELAENVLPKLVKSLSPGDNTTFIIKYADGVRAYGSPPPSESRLTVTSPFIENFPPWSIELYQNDPHFFEQLLSVRQSFYILALIIVMIALTFGAIMTTRMMNRELELARLKSDFVSTVSHEFRSPLTSIRQLSEMLQSGRVISDERRNQYYDIILEQSERLSLLISNILDLARIDERRLKLDYEQVDIKELLADIVIKARQHSGGEEIPIILKVDDSLPLAFVDPGAITHIMNNLIDNAVKYSGKYPEVSITARTENNEMVITVDDRGIGIPKEDIQKIFERFYRAGDELTRKVKGSGLGLALVKEFVQAHGGSIRAFSEIEKGSVFTIRLPLAGDKERGNG